MKANIKLDLTLEQRDVAQNLSINSVEDMDDELFKEVVNIFCSTKKKIQKVVDKYYGVSQDTEEEAVPAPGNSGGDD